MAAPSRRRRITYLEAAADDVRRLHREDPALALVVLQRLADLAKGRLDGEPLERRPSADLSDCRKIYVGRTGGRPTHRIVYRAIAGGAIEVIEVIAVGRREGMAVYLEAAERLGQGGVTPSHGRIPPRRTSYSIFKEQVTGRPRPTSPRCRSRFCNGGRKRCIALLLGGYVRRRPPPAEALSPVLPAAAPTPTHRGGRSGAPATAPAPPPRRERAVRRQPARRQRRCAPAPQRPLTVTATNRRRPARSRD